MATSEREEIEKAEYKVKITRIQDMYPNMNIQVPISSSLEELKSIHNRYVEQVRAEEQIRNQQLMAQILALMVMQSNIHGPHN